MRKLLVSLTILVISSLAWAGNPESFEIMLTPVVNYSISISTPDGGINFDQKALDSAFVSETSVTVKNTGNASADWTIKASPMNIWALGTTLSDNGDDKAVIAAIFNSTQTRTVDYTDNDVITTIEKDADLTNFAGDQDGNNVIRNEENLLWIYFKTPNDTSVDTQQKFHIEIRAYPASKF